MRRNPTGCWASTFPASALLLSFALLLLTGVIAANFFGARLIRFWENVLGRIPGRQVDLLVGQAGQRHAALGLRQCVPQGAAGRISAPGQLDHRVPDRNARAGGGHAPRRRPRERVRSDHAESDVGLFHHRAALASARTRHDRRRSAEVRDLDGRRVAACACTSTGPARTSRIAGRAARTRGHAFPKLTGQRRADAAPIAAASCAPAACDASDQLIAPSANLSEISRETH